MALQEFADYVARTERERAPEMIVYHGVRIDAERVEQGGVNIDRINRP